MVISILITIYLVVVGLEIPRAYKSAMTIPPEDKPAAFMTAVSVSLIWPLLWGFGLLFFGTMWVVNLLTGKRD